MKNIAKILCFVLSLVLVFSVIGISTFANEATGLTGSGTETDPYLINNVDELKFFADSVNKGETTYNKKNVYVALAADIDLENNEWTPIGTKAKPFVGIFDGKGYTVSNLYINNADLSYAGLIGYAKAAKINNVNVHNVNINAYYCVGGIAGQVYTGSLTNCHVSGSINLVASYAYAGGITSNGYVTIRDCSVIADGTGVITVGEKTMAGGIIGWMGEGNNGVYNCTVKNLNITAWTSVGAINGLVHYNNTISGCTAENINLVKTRENGQAAIGLAAGNWSNKSSGEYTITITNNTFTNVTLSGSAMNHTNNLYGANYSAYVYDISLVEEGNTLTNITSDIDLAVFTEADLQNALYVAENGDTVKLFADIELTSGLIVSGKTITLDLAGHTVSLNVATYSLRNANVLLSLVDGANITITGEGTMLANGGEVIAVDATSTAAIENGNFDSDVSAFLANDAKLIEKADGTFGVAPSSATPEIIDGYWWIGGINTGLIAVPTIEMKHCIVHDTICWFITQNDGTDSDKCTGVQAIAKDGVLPEVKMEGGYWYIDNKDGRGFVPTGIPAVGAAGVTIDRVVKNEEASDEYATVYVIYFSNNQSYSFTVVNGVKGPQGPQGPQGPDGPIGDRGEPGDPGKDANDNNTTVIIVIAIATVCIIFTLSVVLYRGIDRRSWWCTR